MNIMTNDAHWRGYGYAEERMTFQQDTQRKYDRRQEAKKEEGCIQPVHQKGGSRFNELA